MPLATVLRLHTKHIDKPEPKLYSKLSVKLYGRGVVLDQPVLGSNLKMKRHQLAKAGQVILSEIWGKKGAIGLVPKEGDGALCTSHFFLFDVDDSKVDLRYLQALFTANYLEPQLNAKAQGTTGYAAVRPKNLLAASIPLPSLTEQRRVADKITGLCERTNSVLSLCSENAELVESLCRAFLRRTRGTPVPMRELLTLRELDVRVDRSQLFTFAGVYSFGKGVFKSITKSGMEFAYERLTRVEAGDFIYPKLMAWEGALGVVPPECAGLVASPEFPVFRVNSERVLPETLDVYFRSPAIWPELFSISTGTNVRRRRLHPSEFLKYKIPLPEMPNQLLLKKIREAANEVQGLRRDSMRSVKALESAILEKAFNGEL